MAGQAWNRQGELDRAVLRRARMLLVAIAALVERAAFLPLVERLRFLAVMAHGEAEARRLIGAMASGPGAPVEADAAPAMPVRSAEPCPPVCPDCDAALLAARFRMLALAVDALLALIRGQFTYFPRSRLLTRRSFCRETSKLSPYFLHAARGPPLSRVRTEITRP